ncbi:hypothetical protein SCLCIDRAFT_32559 [Scleroderma citrinum Foug A]|uniref:Uncharacterized protein n=1 Tax=Scleroderma citrinum Foug A TaxID=1036808 RepID=A0A0C3CVF4_9AGAM|nr:hypothetical protein SCLCIDRAFT_32559 [Scleroderma citrinum Foug A]
MASVCILDDFLHDKHGDTTLPLCVAHRIRKPELAAVCHRWRDIIVNTPLLWTFIELSPDWTIMSLLKAHVERSQECPLVIVCHGARWTSRDGPYDYNASLDIMVPTVHRWRSLTLADHYDGNRILADRLHDGRTVFPLLTHVFITCYDKWYRPDFLHPDYVPALKHLEAPITHFTPMHPPFSPALEEITIRELHGSTHGCSIPNPDPTHH